MNCLAALNYGQRVLEEAGIDTARLDTLILLEDATNLSREHLLSEPEEEIAYDCLVKFKQTITKRSNHIPLAYIRFKAEFYGRDFLVTPAVLQPRPESEAFIELLANCLKPNDQLIEVGTGSGALIISALLEFPGHRAYATDIDAACLDVAKKNANKHNCQIEWYEGDLITCLPRETWQNPSVLIANLPYVPDGSPINQAAEHEPPKAIFGGPDGLDYYRALLTMIASLANPPHSLMLESQTHQHKALIDLALKTGYGLDQEQGYVQLFKISQRLSER